MRLSALPFVCQKPQACGPIMRVKSSLQSLAQTRPINEKRTFLEVGCAAEVLYQSLQTRCHTYTLSHTQSISVSLTSPTVPLSHTCNQNGQMLYFLLIRKDSSISGLEHGLDKRVVRLHSVSACHLLPRTES